MAFSMKLAIEAGRHNLADRMPKRHGDLSSPLAGRI
jgi:thiazole synthase ThiGH ThiG subunit